MEFKKKEKPLMKYRRQKNKGCLERKRDVCKLFRKLCKLIIPVTDGTFTGLHGNEDAESKHPQALAVSK